jgi:hypothetical protein
MAGMANKNVRSRLLIGLLIYLGIIAVAAICAFRFTTHPWIWVLAAIGIMPFVLGSARVITAAIIKK